MVRSESCFWADEWVNAIAAGRGKGDGEAVDPVALSYAVRCAWFDDYLPPDISARLRRFGPPP